MPYSPRPDIIYAVNKLAEYPRNPETTHCRALMHVVCFIGGQVDYIYAAVACMRETYPRMLICNLKFMGCGDHNKDSTKLEPARIFMYNEAAIFITKSNKVTAGNHHVARRNHYVQQGTALRTKIWTYWHKIPIDRSLDKTWIRKEVSRFIGIHCSNLGLLVMI